MSLVILRPVEDGDLPFFFEWQADEESYRMAAVAARDEEAFTAHWSRWRSEPDAMQRTIVVDGDVEMARVVVTGTMAAGFAGIEGSGRSFRIDQAVITHLRGGKIAEAWEIADIAALREQVGSV